MSNVVSFSSALRKKRAPVEVELPTNDVLPQATDFISDYLYHWAERQNIDTSSISFKYDAAVIMTVIQGMLKKND